MSATHSLRGQGLQAGRSPQIYGSFRFQTAPSQRSPSMTNHTVTHPRCSPALTFFLLSSTSDYLTCSMYFTVDSLSATLKMSSPSRKVLSPYPTPCPSPAQRTGQDTAGRCSAPSRLQHRGQARTQQGGTQPPSVCSTKLRPALGRWGADAQSTPKRQTRRLLSRAPLEGCPGARHEEMLAHDLLMDPQRQEGTTL